jgi:hypothetical protein
MPNLDARIYRYLKTHTEPGVEEIADAFPRDDRFTVMNTVEKMIKQGRLTAHTVRNYLIDGPLVFHSWIRAV